MMIALCCFKLCVFIFLTIVSTITKSGGEHCHINMLQRKTIEWKKTAGALSPFPLPGITMEPFNSTNHATKNRFSQICSRLNL
jgi:hypothetical protein